MKVLVLIDGLGTGGAERSLALVADGLAPRGISTRFVVLHRRSAGVQDSVAERHPIAHLDGTWPSRIKAFRNLTADDRPALVHTSLFNATLLGRLATPRAIPILTSLVNTSYSQEHRSTIAPAWKLRVYQAVDAMTARRTTHFHAISETVKRSATRSLGIPPGSITVVPRGRPKELIHHRRNTDVARLRAGLGVPDDSSIVLHVGRQEPQKGHLDLLDAFALVRSASRRPVLVLAGRPGNATPQIEARIRRHDLGDSVRILGHRSDVPDLLAAADVFVFPSVYEGLGGALLEAMAVGTPAVVTDIPVFREVTDDGRGATVVPPRDPAALADAIQRVLNDRDLRDTLTANARNIFLSRYTLEHMVDGMERLYRRLAER